MLNVATRVVEFVKLTAVGVIIAPVDPFIALTIGTEAKSVPVIVTCVEVLGAIVDGLTPVTAGLVPPPPDSAAK